MKLLHLVLLMILTSLVSVLVKPVTALVTLVHKQYTCPMVTVTTVGEVAPEARKGFEFYMVTTSGSNPQHKQVKATRELYGVYRC